MGSLTICLPMIFTQRHIAYLLTGPKDNPAIVSTLGYATSSSFCSWDGRSLNIRKVYSVVWNAYPLQCISMMSICSVGGESGATLWL